MSTPQEKAERWLNDNVRWWNRNQLDSLVSLLKEQDRDTRHACAKEGVGIATVEDFVKWVSTWP